MSPDLRAEALDLALADAAPTGDADMDAAVAQATADIAAIRAGLASLAQELPVADAPRSSERRRRGLWLSLAVAVVAAAVGGWAALGGGGPGARSSSPHFRTDTFDYRPGGMGSSIGAPFMPYGLPRLSAISASSASDAWIVGSIAWHWNGSRWGSVALPTVSGDASLSSVVALGPRDAWAVGSRNAPSDEILATHPLVEHWNGVRWSVIPMPLAGAGAFNSVSADASNDLWAVGWSVPPGTTRQESDTAMRPLIAHWDGRSWRVTHLPEAGPDALANVVALAPDDVWVAGPGISRTGTSIVQRWDGSRWLSIRAPFGTRDPNFTLTADSATDAWAVGGQEVGGHSRTMAAHWNGQAWMIAPTPNQNTDSMLVDVHAISPTDVWALGQSQFMSQTGNETSFTTPVAIYEHWNGHRWSLAPVASEREGLEFLAATHGAVWAAGGCYYQNIVTRWSGHTWQPVRHPPDITWDPSQPKRDRHPPATSCLSNSPT
jgi:hypothetical protein